MRITIDRQARWALYDAARSEIEGCSDLRIDVEDGNGFERRKVRDLWARLRLLGPLLDQLGWEPEPDRDFFEVRLDVRRMRPFLRKHVREMEAVLGEGVTTEAQLREAIADFECHTGEATTEEQFADGLAEMRARVDRDLELLAAYRRLLDVVGMPAPTLAAVA